MPMDDSNSQGQATMQFPQAGHVVQTPLLGAACLHWVAKRLQVMRNNWVVLDLFVKLSNQRPQSHGVLCGNSDFHGFSSEARGLSGTTN